MKLNIVGSKEATQHSHFCDYAGHTWECAGTAQRSLTGGSEPSLCMCQVHQVPMSEGDHSECPVELLACPEHRDEQLKQMAAASSSPTRTEDTLAGQSAVFKDGDGEPIVGFCLWCGNDFYSIDEMNTHNADGMLACIGFQEMMKDGDSNDLQSIFEVLSITSVEGC
ncbi:hypothetical protein [Granulicella aggregans]|uniref:hypothetical protein n=1 Tax=Granulicella aggregans TaxID=474949 RepID=UPI0021E052A1|nr:hypothetical protein [Granulicella aggregans]